MEGELQKIFPRLLCAFACNKDDRRQAKDVSLKKAKRIKKQIADVLYPCNFPALETVLFEAAECLAFVFKNVENGQKFCNCQQVLNFLG